MSLRWEVVLSQHLFHRGQFCHVLLQFGLLVLEAVLVDQGSDRGGNLVRLLRARVPTELDKVVFQYFLDST